jgi:nucleotide-binding universal stress UspA family protein
VANQIDGFSRSTHADLIVAAEPAGRTAGDVLHGTFAARLVQHGDCPVLTVNEPASRLTAQPAAQEELDLVGASR